MHVSIVFVLFADYIKIIPCLEICSAQIENNNDAQEEIKQVKLQYN